MSKRPLRGDKVSRSKGKHSRSTAATECYRVKILKNQTLRQPDRVATEPHQQPCLPEENLYRKQEFK